MTPVDSQAPRPAEQRDWACAMSWNLEALAAVDLSDGRLTPALLKRSRQLRSGAAGFLDPDDALRPTIVAAASLHRSAHDSSTSTTSASAVRPSAIVCTASRIVTTREYNELDYRKMVHVPFIIMYRTTVPRKIELDYGS